MRIIQVVPHVGHAASGPSYSVPRLCQALGECGDSVFLLTLARGNNRKNQGFQHLSYPELRDFGIAASPAMKRALRSMVGNIDIVHSHSLWLMPNVYPAWAADRARKTLVVSPRGTLSPVALARSYWRKRIFWWLLQRRAIHQAKLLHATSQQEYLDIRAAGLTQPVAIIPNGVDIPPNLPPRLAQDGQKTLLYLGRLHPIKGLDMLLRAWGRLEERFPDWELKLVGPGEADHVLALKRLAASLDLPRVTFAGPRYGAQRGAEYAAADLYVLPSFSENFGMSVAEALASGTPVLTTTGTPWKNLDQKNVGWCVAPEINAFTQALESGLATDPADLRAMGARGYQWMREDFSWSFVGLQMQAAYLWLLGRGPMPDCVRLS